MNDPTEVRRKLVEAPEEHAQAAAVFDAYLFPHASHITTTPPISTIAGTSIMITPQQRYEFRLDFGKRISHLTLTERDALELIARLRESIRAARKAQQVTP